MAIPLGPGAIGIHRLVRVGLHHPHRPAPISQGLHPRRPMTSPSCCAPPSPGRRLVRELQLLATVMRAVMPTVALGMLQPILAFGMPSLRDPVFSLHCQRSHLPRHDRCQLTRLHALSLSRQTLSFPLAALQETQIETSGGFDGTTLEQLVLLLRPSAPSGGSTPPPTRLELSAADIRHKSHFGQRVHAFQADTEQDRLDLLILPLDFWTVVAMALAIPLASLVIWFRVRSAACWR